MDALADILETVQLAGSVYCRSDLTAPWGMSVPESRQAHFHVLRRGRCFLRLEQDPGFEPLRLEVGDVVLLPQGSAHALVDQPDRPALPLAELLTRHAPCGAGAPLVFGGGGEPVTLICGYVRFDAGAVHPLLSVLPTVVSVRGEAGRARSWLESTLDLIADESTAGRPGGETLINRLTEALFIQVLRAHLEEQQNATPSWLAGLRDPQIAEALAHLHHAPGRQWTVQSLAKEVAMSRSAFSARFRALVGEPPLSYLTRWRMQVAANHLRDPQLTLPEIANRVGYQAEASFSKVFKRLWGVSPAAFRRGRGGHDSVAATGTLRSNAN